MSRLMTIVKINNQSGAVAIITAILITVFIGFVALSIDIGHLAVTKNELQNAADAGALAGARELYNAEGTAIQTGIILDSDNNQIATSGCNEIAYNTATANLSEQSAVEINWTPGENDGSDVERGHWSFGRGADPRGFTANASTGITVLFGVSDAALDDNEDFINAVRVTTRREDTPIQSFFAGIFGHDNFQQNATAIAYLGFAGSYGPGEFEVPIALCEEFLLKDESDPTYALNPYECGVAVMFESAENAMWTNMEQPIDEDGDGSYPACDSGNAADLKDLVETGNINSVDIGVDVGVTNGMVSSAHAELILKWLEKTMPDPLDPTTRTAWDITLPVVDCVDESGETNTCAELVRGVEVKLLWMTKMMNAQGYAKTPYTYYDTVTEEGQAPELKFQCTEEEKTDDYARWDSFATALGLLNEDGTPIQLALNQLWFEAECGPATPAGGTGGPNTGILARRPVLVR